MDSPEVATRARTSPTATSGGVDAMSADTMTRARTRPVSTGQPPAPPARPALHAHLGLAWPKLLAIGLVLGVWQLLYLDRVATRVRAALPRQTLSTARGHARHREFWSSLATTLRRAVIGFAAALVIGTTIGVAVARIRRCASRRLAHHRPADHAVDRLVPAGHPAVRPQRAGDPVRGRPGRGAQHRQRRHRRHRPRAAGVRASWAGPRRRAVSPLPPRRPACRPAPTWPGSPRAGRSPGAA
jgi:hypothetical protein